MKSKWTHGLEDCVRTEKVATAAWLGERGARAFPSLASEGRGFRRRQLFPALLSPFNLEPGADIERQAHEANRCHALVVGQILRKGVNPKPRQDLVASAEVEPCVSMVEVAIGEQQTIATVDVHSAQEG